MVYISKAAVKDGGLIVPRLFEGIANPRDCVRQRGDV